MMKKYIIWIGEILLVLGILVLSLNKIFNHKKNPDETSHEEIILSLMIYQTHDKPFLEDLLQKIVSGMM